MFKNASLFLIRKNFLLSVVIEFRIRIRNNFIIFMQIRFIYLEYAIQTESNYRTDKTQTSNNRHENINKIKGKYTKFKY